MIGSGMEEEREERRRRFRVGRRGGNREWDGERVSFGAEGGLMLGRVDVHGDTGIVLNMVLGIL
jgi:hypothetical protein